MKIKPMNIIFWGAVITIIGALITAIGTFKQNKSSSSKMQKLTDNSDNQTKKIEHLQTQNDQLSLTINNLNQKSIEQLNTIVELSKQNSELALQLSSATKTLYDNITGDQSFCEFRIQPYSDDSARLILIHHGNSPIYNVGVNITDIAMFRANNNIQDKMRKSKVFLQIGDVNKNTAGESAILTSDFSFGKRRFNLQISTRTRMFSQNILLVKINGIWESATQIKYFEIGNQEKIYESIDTNFPIAEVIW